MNTSTSGRRDSRALINQKSESYFSAAIRIIFSDAACAIVSIAAAAAIWSHATSGAPDSATGRDLLFAFPWLAAYIIRHYSRYNNKNFSI